MSAAEALKAARAAGVQLDIDGDDLVLEAAVPPPPAVIDLLSSHKASIVALLRRAEDGWSAEDGQVLFDERAAIIEFDGGAYADLGGGAGPCSIRRARPATSRLSDGCNSLTIVVDFSTTVGGPVPRRSAGGRSICSAAIEKGHSPASIVQVCFGLSTAASS